MVTSISRVVALTFLAWIGMELHLIRIQTKLQQEATSVARGTASQMRRLEEETSGCSPRMFVADTSGLVNQSHQPRLTRAGTTLRSLAPTLNVSGGSVGNGAQHSLTTRSGGAPQYGNALFEYLVTAPIGDAQFDVGASFWTTASNLSAGSASLFGAWVGANTPATTETFGGGSVIGMEINAGNRFGDFGVRTDVGGTRSTVGIQVVPDVVPTTDTVDYIVTMTKGSPGLVNWTDHRLTANTPLYFTGKGPMPAPMTAGKTYYVLAAGLTSNSFHVASKIGGLPIDFAASSTGSVRAIPSYPGSFAQMIGPSIHAHKWWVGNLLRYDSIMPGGYAHHEAGGSASAVNNPKSWTSLAGYWVNGLDFSGAVFSGATMVFSVAQTATTASDGGSGVGLPAHVYKYVKANIAGQDVVWPVYLP